MTVYRVTIGWNQSVLGATETYWTPDVTEFANLIPLVNGLLARRVRMLFANQEIVGVRIAREPLLRASTFFIPGQYTFKDLQALVIPSRGNRTLGTTEVSRPDQLRAALEVLVYYGLERRKTVRYLAGIPDSATGYEPESIQRAVGVNWFQDFNVFFGGLVENGWQIRTKMYTGIHTYRLVRNWYLQEAAPGYLGFSLSTDDALNLSATRKVHVTGVRWARKGLPSLNGNFYIDSVNLTQIDGQIIYYLRNTEGQDPNNVKIPGKVQLVGYGYSPIVDYFLQRALTHKRGKPLAVPRGRRLTRNMLDP